MEYTFSPLIRRPHGTVVAKCKQCPWLLRGRNHVIEEAGRQHVRMYGHAVRISARATTLIDPVRASTAVVVDAHEA